MLVLSVEQSVELVEAAIGDLGSVVGSHDPAVIKEKAHAAWRKLGEARALLRRPDLYSPQPGPVVPGSCPEVHCAQA